MLKTPEKHIKHIGVVLRLLKNADVALKDVTAFFANRFDCVGYIVHLVESKSLIVVQVLSSNSEDPQMSPSYEPP